MKATKKDLRPIFAVVIKAVDMTDRDNAVRKAEEEQQKAIIAKSNEAKAVVQYQIVKSECERLKDQVEILSRENQK